MRENRSYKKTNWLAAPREEIVAHGGAGTVGFVRLLTDSAFTAGCNFVDYAVVHPGSSVGRHQHAATEEIYFILSGSGTMWIDGALLPVKTGDMVLTSIGGTHELHNDSNFDLTMLAIELPADSSALETLEEQ